MSFNLMFDFYTEQIVTLPDVKLLKLLKVTYPYIMVGELKSVPISIIKRIGVIPERYLRSLANPTFRTVLNVCSLTAHKLFSFHFPTIITIGIAISSPQTSLEYRALCVC